jgi:hypothetical protein
MCCMADVPEHFVKDAKLLSCGDYVCDMCIVDGVEIKCNRCGQLNDLDMTKLPVIKLVEVNIKENLENLSTVLHSNMIELESEIKSMKYFCYALTIRSPRIKHLSN